MFRVTKLLDPAAPKTGLGGAFLPWKRTSSLESEGVGEAARVDGSVIVGSMAIEGARSTKGSGGEARLELRGVLVSSADAARELDALGAV